MISQDPTKHGLTYLQDIAEKDWRHKICTRCRLIIPEDARSVHHCDYCDVCVEGHDHHCVWCSKCIGGGNLIFFSGFLFLTVACILGFWFNMLNLVIYETKNV